MVQESVYSQIVDSRGSGSNIAGPGPHSYITTVSHADERSTDRSLDAGVHAATERDPVMPCASITIVGNTGWMSVGIDHDTAGFAANAIRRC
jgi:hypothetical protein